MNVHAATTVAQTGATAVRAVGTASIECRPAVTPADLADHHAIRHEVFVREQSVFAESDLDDHDRDGSTIRFVGYCDGVAAGTVRLFRLDGPGGLWQGDRLAVLPQFRVHGLGAPLVRCAVATAGVHGGSEMLAHVQLANVTFFTRLGWTAVGAGEIYVGLPHQRMRIALPAPDVRAALPPRQRLTAGLSARSR